MKNKLLLPLIALLSFLGFVDSAYLTITHYQNIIPPCSIVTGCETVLNSSFSEFLGIPVALFGSIYFAVLTIFLILMMQKNLKNGRKILLIFTSFGALGAIYFLSVQAFVIKAFCQYCLVADLTALAIFALSLKFINLRGRNIETKLSLKLML